MRPHIFFFLLFEGVLLLAPLRIFSFQLSEIPFLYRSLTDQNFNSSLIAMQNDSFLNIYTHEWDDSRTGGLEIRRWFPKGWFFSLDYYSLTFRGLNKQDFQNNTFYSPWVNYLPSRDDMLNLRVGAVPWQYDVSPESFFVFYFQGGVGFLGNLLSLSLQEGIHQFIEQSRGLPENYDHDGKINIDFILDPSIIYYHVQKNGALFSYGLSSELSLLGNFDFRLWAGYWLRSPLSELGFSLSYIYHDDSKKNSIAYSFNRFIESGIHLAFTQRVGGLFLLHDVNFLLDSTPSFRGNRSTSSVGIILGSNENLSENASSSIPRLMVGLRREGQVLFYENHWVFQLPFIDSDIFTYGKLYGMFSIVHGGGYFSFINTEQFFVREDYLRSGRISLGFLYDYAFWNLVDKQGKALITIEGLLGLTGGLSSYFIYHNVPIYQRYPHKTLGTGFTQGILGVQFLFPGATSSSRTVYYGIGIASSVSLLGYHPYLSWIQPSFSLFFSSQEVYH